MASLIDEIREWFVACGYVVTEEVGLAEGTVDRFATPRQGLMPPRSWWTVVDRFPADLAEANDSLDLLRDSVGADRALAIVTDEASPEGYLPDLNSGVASYVSFRYLALHLAGVLDELSRLVAAPSAKPYFPHRIDLSRGETADACALVEAWIDSGTGDQLELQGPFFAREEIALEVGRRRARGALGRPEQVVPVVFQRWRGSSEALTERLLQKRWAVQANIPVLREGGIAVRRRAIFQGLVPAEYERVTAQIAAPSDDEVLRWIATVAPELPIEPLRRWFVRDPMASRLFAWSSLRTPLLQAAREERGSSSEDAWLTRALARSLARALETLPMRDQIAGPLEEAALRDFALGDAGLAELRRGSSEQLAQLGLLTPRDGSSSGAAASAGFSSRVVRDYFLARKIAREVRSGNRDILTRYVFPRDDVGLFLAVIAPDVAALAGAGRAEDLRREVESEVARRVELTLGHQLNRSIGTIGTHVATLRRALRESEPDERARAAFSRIDEELDHLRKLTDRSRLLNESQEWEVASLPLGQVLSSVLEPIREKQQDVSLEVSVPPEIVVRAALDGLREILHCLIENAFHSVCAQPEAQPRNIHISAVRVGETIRVQIRDNGVGVRPEDRERIFQPFVTTKTGGPGRPRGTGLGLSIARTFAERMHARVALEASNGETVFVVILVAGD